MSKKDVVYQIPCRDCSSVYIGEMGRALSKKVAEHKYAVKTGGKRNRVAVHAWDEQHAVDWEGVKILEPLEIIWIKKTEGRICSF